MKSQCWRRKDLNQSADFHRRDLLLKSLSVAHSSLEPYSRGFPHRMRQSRHRSYFECFPFRISFTKNNMAHAKNFGALKASGYHRASVKDELRANLIKKLRAGERLFPGIVGYDETVLPQLVNAILARHNLILLGLRGQAKSRIIRQLTNLLDDAIPIIAGSEVNDNPFHPISAHGRQMI